MVKNYFDIFIQLCVEVFKKYFDFDWHIFSVFL
jgi:hypothetical protein